MRLPGRLAPTLFVLMTLAICCLPAGPHATAAGKHPPTPTAFPYKLVTIRYVKDRYVFLGGTVTIRRGSAIVWANRTDYKHNVTFDSGARWDKEVDYGQNLRYMFTKRSVYRYHCSIHPYMKGTITVR